MEVGRARCSYIGVVVGVNKIFHSTRLCQLAGVVTDRARRGCDGGV